MVRAGDNGCPEKFLRIKSRNSTIKIGPFSPAKLGPPPPHPCVAKEDRSWRDLQSQWGSNALAISRSLIRLGTCPWLCPRLITMPLIQVSMPLSYTLRLAGINFNHLSIRRCHHLVKGLHDQQLDLWLENSRESFTGLFPFDVSGALSASQARHTNGLLSQTSRSGHHPVYLLSFYSAFLLTWLESRSVPLTTPRAPKSARPVEATQVLTSMPSPRQPTPRPQRPPISWPPGLLSLLR